jgi:hypothetical protein
MPAAAEWKDSLPVTTAAVSAVVVDFGGACTLQHGPVTTAAVSAVVVDFGGACTLQHGPSWTSAGVC